MFAHNEEIRNIFNRVIEDQTDPDVIAKLELVREYFTNPDFKKKFEEYSYNLTKDL